MYEIVHRGRVIGHSTLEYSSEIVGSIGGVFHPSDAFAGVEAELRPYGPSLYGVGPDGSETWQARDDEPLPPMTIEIRDADGNILPARHVRIAWPGDFPGWDFLRVMADAPAPAGPDQLPPGIAFMREMQRVLGGAAGEIGMIGFELRRSPEEMLAALRALPDAAGPAAVMRALGHDPDTRESGGAS